MTDKEKIIAYIDKLLKKYPKNYYLLTVAEFIDSLQEEPASEDLEKASKEWLRPQLDKSYADYGERKMMDLTRFDGYAMLDAIEFGAQYQMDKMMKGAVDGGCFSYKNGYVHISCDIDEHLTDIKFGDKVKVIIIKEQEC